MCSFILRLTLLMTIGCVFAAQLTVVRVARRKTNEKYKFAPFPLCVRADMQFSAYVKRSSPSKVFIEASNERKAFTDSYQVQGFAVDPSWSQIQLKQQLMAKEVCRSFLSQKTGVYAADYHIVYIVHYLKGPDDWWCDVYEGIRLKSSESGSCPGLLDDYSAMADPIYNSVDTPQQSRLKLKPSDGWTPCKVSDHRALPTGTLCTDTFTGVKTSLEFYCKENNHQALGYKIVQWYKRHTLSSYTLPNSEHLGTTEINQDVKTRMCRLFRFAKETDQFVYVQYLHEGNLTCEKFRYGKSGYVKARRAGTCKRYFQGKLVK